MRVKLDNFILEDYNETNPEHKKTIAELNSDVEGRMYLGNLKLTVECLQVLKEQSQLNHTFIAYYNGEPIGFILITDNCDYEICYGIRPKYRGEYFGALLLLEFSEKMFEDFEEIKELKLYIDENNIGSIKTAKLAGYEEENEDNFYSMRRM